MLKTGLNIARFKEHVKIIEAETREYFQRWGDSGERSKIHWRTWQNHILERLTLILWAAQTKMSQLKLWFSCVRPVWGFVWADHPDSQQLPSWEGDPQLAGWTSGPAVRRPGWGLHSCCLAPARLAAPAQLQVRLLETTRRCTVPV